LILTVVLSMTERILDLSAGSSVASTLLSLSCALLATPGLDVCRRCR
jgi:hypothetical protein